MKSVVSRKYFKNKLWKITTYSIPVYADKKAKESQAFNLVKCYEKKINGNGYEFIKHQIQVELLFGTNHRHQVSIYLSI